MVHAMGVDRDRAADAENIGRLHGANRKTRVQHILDVVPGRARLHGDRSRTLVEHDLVEAAHVEHDAALAEGVPPMLWRTPAVVTESLLSRAKASVFAISSTLRTSTTP
jgi:hypothetical protein